MKASRLAPLLAALLLACGHAPVAAPVGPRPTSRGAERAELLAKLKRDLIKVDRSIGVTERLIAQSRTEPYLPDLVFRLAELYVEKSRYRFHLERELNADAARGSLVVPEVTLLKQKAISLYERVLREHPDFKDGDQVRFFAAHEHRELGQYDKAIKVYEELVEKHPKSPLAAESLLIVGDYHFDRSELDKAESFYERVLEMPPGPALELARYKLGWVWINRGKHAEAVKHFEAAAKAPSAEGAGQRSLAVKGLALSDLVYSYTESRPAKGAIEYFESLCDSANVFEAVLEKLGNRYFIKQEFENAAPAFRRLLVMSRDFERDPERAVRLYETLKASKGKVAPRADDVRALVRVAARARVDLRMEEKERAELLQDLEVYARDLATTMQLEAQKKDERRLHSEAADAYEAYLDLFRADKWRLAMMRNRADALFSANRFWEAGRQYEEVASQLKGSEREAPLYSALVSFQSALKTPEEATAFERTDSRFGIRQIGAFYLGQFPRSANAAKVKFNVARAFYDEGELAKAGELFTAFAIEHPNDPDAPPAAHLALDSYHALKDFKAMAAAGRRLLGASLPASLQQELRGILDASKAEELSEVVISTDAGSGEGAITRLLKIADDPSRANSDVAEKALANAFGHAVAARDLKAVEEIAQKILTRHPRSAAAASAQLTRARFATELGDFDAAARHLESMAELFPGDPKSLEALESAATVRLALGETARAVADLERVAAGSRRAEALARLAEARATARDWAAAQQTAEKALEADPGSARAAAVLGEALLEQGRTAEAEGRLVAVGRGLQKAANSDPEALAKVYFLWGEAMFRQFEALGPSDIERKAAALQTIQQAYSSAAQLGGDWAIAGMYRLSQALGLLADTLEKLPEPPGLKEKERAELQATLQQQARDLRKGAGEALEACAKKASELEVFTPFARACATRQPLDASAAATPAASGRAAQGEQLGTWRDRLAKDPNDAAALEALGRAWLEAGDLRRARLAFERLVEVDDDHGPGFAALGFTLARLGETGQARQALRRALELDAGNTKARANLAALKCRFGDAAGAREELRRVKKAPEGADVDREFEACRK